MGGLSDVAGKSNTDRIYLLVSVGSEEEAVLAVKSVGTGGLFVEHIFCITCTVCDSRAHFATFSIISICLYTLSNWVNREGAFFVGSFVLNGFDKLKSVNG